MNKHIVTKGHGNDSEANFKINTFVIF